MEEGPRLVTGLRTELYGEWGGQCQRSRWPSLKPLAPLKAIWGAWRTVTEEAKASVLSLGAPAALQTGRRGQEDMDLVQQRLHVAACRAAASGRPRGPNLLSAGQQDCPIPMAIRNWQPAQGDAGPSVNVHRGAQGINWQIKGGVPCLHRQAGELGHAPSPPLPFAQAVEKPTPALHGHSEDHWPPVPSLHVGFWGRGRQQG